MNYLLNLVGDDDLMILFYSESIGSNDGPGTYTQHVWELLYE